MRSTAGVFYFYNGSSADFARFVFTSINHKVGDKTTFLTITAQIVFGGSAFFADRKP